eukprot:11187307-Lingulodinium_polyedra.AAC.1
MGRGGARGVRGPRAPAPGSREFAARGPVRGLGRVGGHPGGRSRGRAGVGRLAALVHAAAGPRGVAQRR